jgi:hypothetical protein
MRAHDHIQNQFSLFGIMRRPKMKCAASPGGTFGILLPAPALSTARGKPIRDSILPQGPILKENLLVVTNCAVANACGGVNP